MNISIYGKTANADCKVLFHDDLYFYIELALKRVYELEKRSIHIDPINHSMYAHIHDLRFIGISELYE